jgi:hypothetical protein
LKNPAYVATSRANTIVVIEDQATKQRYLREPYLMGSELHIDCACGALIRPIVGAGCRKCGAKVVQVRQEDDGLCPIQVKLTEQHTAAESAYRSSVARMKEMRGQEFERAWRLLEHRRASLERARQVLREHEQEHLCGIQKPSTGITGYRRSCLS